MTISFWLSKQSNGHYLIGASINAHFRATTRISTWIAMKYFKRLAWCMLQSKCGFFKWNNSLSDILSIADFSSLSLSLCLNFFRLSQKWNFCHYRTLMIFLSHNRCTFHHTSNNRLSFICSSSRHVGWSTQEN